MPKKKIRIKIVEEIIKIKAIYEIAFKTRDEAY